MSYHCWTIAKIAEIVTAPSKWEAATAYATTKKLTVGTIVHVLPSEGDARVDENDAHSAFVVGMHALS